MVDQLSFMGRTKQFHLSLPPSWPGTTKHVATVMFTFANDDGGGILPAVDTIAAHAGEPERTIQRIIRFFYDGGFMTDDLRFEFKDGTTTRPRRFILERFDPMRKPIKERGVTYGTRAINGQEGVPPVADTGATHGAEPVPPMAPKPKSLTKDSNQKNQPSDLIGSEGVVGPIKPTTDLVKEAVEIWNDVCGLTLPKVAKLTDARKRTLLSRLKEWMHNDLGEWRTYCESVASSDFLSGRAGDFRASFDWVLGQKNIVKVMEGNYANRSPAPQTIQRHSAAAVPEPAADDPYGVRAWADTLPDTHLDRTSFDLCLGSWELLPSALDICRATGVAPNVGMDLAPIAEWLRMGIDPDKIIEVIRLGKRPDRPNLRFWQGRVMELLSKASS